jgi:hypothetical protein
VALLQQLVDRAQREGAMRPEVGAGDLAVLLALVLRPLPGAPPAVVEGSAQRHIAIVLEGVRARPGDPLPGDPLSLDDLR